MSTPLALARVEGDSEMVRSEKTEVELAQITERIYAALGAERGSSLEVEQRQRLERLSILLARYEVVTDNPIVNVIDHLGNYWRSWLLVILETGTYRHAGLMRLLNAIDPRHPISQRMLTLGLRMLERDGLVRREVFDDARRHVEYSLTPVGRELVERFMSLVAWIDAHADVIEASRRDYDDAAAATTGER